MSHTSTRTIRALTFIAGSVLLIAACGGGSSSSGRQRNAALCYADQAEKDKAVQDAQAAFDASFGGNPPPPDSVAPSDSSVPTSDSVAPDTTVPEESPVPTASSSGGYRRPAVRHFATVPPTEPADSVALTEEQQGFLDALNAAEAMEVCADSSEDASADPVQVTCTATVTVEGVTDDCDTGDVFISDQGVWWLNDVNNAELARGEVDISALSADNPIVIEISYEIAGQESSDTTTPSETQTIECTGTVSGTLENSANSTDCPDAELWISDGSTWFLVKSGGSPENEGDVLARGEVDLSALSADNPIVVPISYEIAAQESSDTTVPGDTVQCSVQMNGTGPVITCSKAVTTLFSEPGQIPLVSDGNAEFTAIGNSGYSVTVSFGEDVYLYKVCKGFNCSGQTYTFDVPASLDDAGEPELPDLSNLPFSTTFTGANQFDFTLTEDSTVSITVNGQACDEPHSDPELWIYGGSAPYDPTTNANLAYYDNDSYGSDDNCLAAFFSGDLDAGDYFIYVSGGNSNPPVTVNSSIELNKYEAPPFEMPQTAFSYSFTTPSAAYSFSLTEPAAVTVTGGNGETCSPDEVDQEGDGIASPEVGIWTAESFAASSDVGESVSDDEPQYGTPDNCVVSVVETDLEPGDYVVYVYMDDGDTGNITIGSSVELTSMRAPSDIKFDRMTTQQIDAVQSYDIVVPAGGAWFRAEGNSHQATDGVDPFLILVDSNNNTIASDDDSGDTNTNYWSSVLEIYLEEGTYRLIATTSDIFWEDCTDCETNYELRYGFGAAASKPQPDVVVTPSNNNQMPTDIPELPKLPVASLVQDSANGIVPALLDGVTSMVCNSTCIDTLFTNAGITDGSIDVSIGDSTVTIKKGQKKAIIKVGARASKISVTATSADGTQKVDLSTPLASVPAAVQQVIESGATVGVSDNSSGLSSKLPYVLVLLVALLGIAAVLNERRKKSVTQS